jgi:hypothetical protein
MKSRTKSYKIKVLSVTSGKQYECETIEYLSKKIGISKYILRRIRDGLHSSFVTNDKGVMYQIQFIADKAVSLVPAWDNLYDEERVGEQVFASHDAAIQFLSERGTHSKRQTYYRRMRKAEIGVPCRDTITDAWNREWIITFFKPKGSFEPNKSKVS